MRRPGARRAASGLLAACIAAALASQAAAQAIPVIGVRKDARPFAWQESGLENTYRGYLVDICQDAVTRAGYHYDQEGISARQREAILDGRFTVPREEGEGSVTIDLLCDPTTITLARLDRFAGDPATQHGIFSPIVFLANGSYVQHKDAANMRGCPVEGAGEAAASEVGAGEEEAPFLPPPASDPPPAGGCAALFPPGFDPSAPGACLGPAGPATSYRVAGYVVGATALNAIERAVRTGVIRLGAGEKLCPRAAASHSEGVRDFCANRYHYYFGDLDIIDAYRPGGPEVAAGSCDMVRAERALSYEPYALLISSADPAFRARVFAAIYEIFADGTAAGRFAHHFAGHTPSSALRMLFRINSIPRIPMPETGTAAAESLAQGEAQAGGGGEGCEGEDCQAQAAQ
jgi:hypothetical protein